MMNDDDVLSKIADVSRRSVDDYLPSEPTTHQPTNEPTARELDRDRRTNPATGIRRARQLGNADGGDWLARDAPPGQEALLTEQRGGRRELYMPAGKVGLLAAPGGTGKTTVLMQLAISVASGRDWLGKYQVNVKRRGRVLIVLGEEDEANIDLLVWKAARAATYTNGLPDDDAAAVRAAIYDNVHTWSVTGLSVAMEHEGGGKYGKFHTSLLAYLDADGGDWSLIIIDPASRFFPTDAETDNAQATRFIESLEVLTDVAGSPAVLFAHHSAKGVIDSETSSQKDSRGSSALVDGGRWMGVLRRTSDADIVALTVSKSNYGPMTTTELERLDGGGFKAANMTPAAAYEREVKAAAAKLRAKDRASKIATDAADRFEKENSNNATGSTKSASVPTW